MKGKLIVVLVLLGAHVVLAGGIVTNSNQSAQFVRTLSRNASTEIDATYFNPAGLTDLADGWHFALYNQTIFQEKTVTNNFQFLNQDEFVGEVNVPFFPNLYATFKQNKLAVSVGFGPNGGGGTAEYKSGLPSFEIPVSLAPLLANAQGYRSEISFNGSSVYYGFQANVAYELTDRISLAVGGRYISAVNQYEGSIKNIQLRFGDDYVPSGIPDAHVDVEQTATGLTPVLGANVKPLENLNIGLRYELNTGLEFTNATAMDGTDMFPDGATFNNDIPAILSVGAEYAFMPQFRGSVSFTNYFDKNANWEGREELVDNNFMEIGLGLEYDLTNALLISAGFLSSNTGVTEAYQTDISHSLSSNTIGFGLRYKLAGALAIDLGTLYTMYDESSREGMQMLPTGGIPYIETYNRSNVAIALGLGYSF